MHDQMGRLPVLDTKTRIPLRPLSPVRRRGRRAAQVVEGEVQLFGRELARHAEDAIVRDQRLELAAERMALDPIHHVAAVAGAQADGAAGIDVRHVLLDVFEALDEILVGQAAPLLLDGVGEGLAVAGGSRGVGADGDVALFGEDGWVPARAPAVAPSALGSSVDEKCERVSFVLVVG